jgi:hypothetical protein
MTETVSPSASADGWNEPTKSLPPLEVSDGIPYYLKEKFAGRPFHALG